VTRELLPHDDALDRLRALCLALPDANERTSHGEPTWFAGKGKSFAMLADHHHDDRFAVWLAAPPGAQEALVGDDPARYFRPPYVGGRGWVGVSLDVAVDWDQLADLVEDAFRCVAGVRLLARLDAEVSPPGRSPGA